MSLKSLLMPVVSQRLLARSRLEGQRARQERQRLARGERRLVHYFHQADDPYSALVAQVLPALLERYDIALMPHLVSPPPDSAAPQRERLVAYSRRDAAMLAAQAGLAFHDLGRQPEAARVEQVRALLVAAIDSGRFAGCCSKLSQSLWQADASADAVRAAADGLTPADAQRVNEHAEGADSLRQSLGHYLGAMFFYAGEWYWGLDRLHHLEQRLTDLGARRGARAGWLFTPPADLGAPAAAIQPGPIDFFVSLRSPYSAIVTPRVFDLARHTGVQVRLRYLLPMVMRGLPVPGEKRRYISLDAAREAHVHGIPFGRLNDPVGRPTERGLSLIPLAERHGLGEAYLRSFMAGVWSEGIDAGSDRGLRRIATRAGLDWDEALLALKDEGWRAVAEANRAEMFALGLWGVPSFRVGTVSTWGQDRLWVVQQALLGTLPSRSTGSVPA